MGAGEKIRVGDDNDPFTGIRADGIFGNDSAPFGRGLSIDLNSTHKHFRSHADHHCVEWASQ